MSVEIGYRKWCVKIPVNFPTVVFHPIAFPLDQVFQSVPSHSAVKNSFDFELLVTFNQHRVWQGFCSASDNWVWGFQRELDDRKYWVQASEGSG